MDQTEVIQNTVDIKEMVDQPNQQMCSATDRDRASSVYIHIPFCVQKCGYCDFNSYANRLSDRFAYIESLCRDIEQIANRLITRGESLAGFKTLYFGGGTPSLLSAASFKRLLSTICHFFEFDADAEWTLELNPGTVLARDFETFRSMGFNRLSMGVQSLSDQCLKTIGRLHSAEDVYASVKAAKQAGFKNISVDLMTGLPGQTRAIALDSAQRIIDLDVQHVSLYSLMLEPNTPFYERYPNGQGLPSDEEERACYEDMLNQFRQAGFIHYEISNLSQVGFESRHNQMYWNGAPYHAFGAGASFYIDGWRGHFEQDLDVFLAHHQRLNGSDHPLMEKNQHPYAGLGIVFDEYIDQHAAQIEFFYLGFRCLTGVYEADYRAKFGQNYSVEQCQILEDLCCQMLIESCIHPVTGANGYRLSRHGLDFANAVFSAFL